VVKLIRWSFLIVCCFLCITAQSQQTSDVSVIELSTTEFPISGKSGFVEIDSDFQEAIPASNDSISAFIELPFSFCYFGRSVDELYINNNGNVSVGSLFSANTPLSFPLLTSLNNLGVIAPFWADIDTRGIGNVRYKLSSTALVVVWNNVGYYNQQTGLTNTFQLVITDGTDPILPIGYNVGFFYKDMEWTTGDQSNGINGFGGIPATIGMNRGVNNQFVSLGRFNQNNDTYLGPNSNSNGVDWLSHRNMYFSLCDSNNIAPIATGIELSDTITVCNRDSIEYTATFIGTTGNTVNTDASTNLLNKTPFGVWENVTVGVSNNTLGFQSNLLNATDLGPSQRFIQFPVVFDVDTLESPTISGATTVCDPNQVVLRVQDAYQAYQWSNGSTIDSVQVSSGTYVVTVGSQLCSATDTHTVQASNPEVDFSGRTWGCFPDTMVIRATPGYDEYRWSTTNMNTDDSLAVSAPGIYFLTVTEGGCSSVDSVVVRVLGMGAIDVLPDTAFVCNVGDSATLMTDSLAMNYAWSSGQTTSSVFVPAGTYTVTVSVTNSSGTTCAAQDSGIVALQLPVAPVISGDTLICGNESTTLSVGGYDSYVWSNGANSSSISVNRAGTYRVTVSENGCTADTVVNVIENAIPTVQITGGRYWCPVGDSVTLYAGLGWDSVLWSNGSINNEIRLETGQVVLQAWLNGCSNTDTATVSQLLDGFDIIGDSVLCPDSTVILYADSTFDTYAWSTGPSADSIIVAEGEYQVTVTKDGCTAISDTFRVRLTTNELEILSDSIICLGTAINLQVINGYQSYLWSTGDTLAAINAVATGTYSLEAIDFNGCILRDTVRTSRVALPDPIITGNMVYCDPAGTVLSTTLPYVEYTWSTAYNTPTTVAAEGIYFVTVVDTNGCEGVSLPYQVLSGEVNPEIEGDSIGCVNNTYTLITPTTGVDFLWSTGDTVDSIQVSNTGVYSLTITNAFGCTDSTTYEILSYPIPFADFTTDPVDGTGKLAEVEFIDLSTVESGGSIVEWAWSFGDGNTANTQIASHSYQTDGFYQQELTVTTADGCLSTLIKDYTINSVLNIPNVITPNGDGINDLLVFGNLEFYPQSSLRIFNRWGELLFEIADYKNNWDGQFMSDGVYYFILEVGGSDETLKGNFTIITQ